MFGRYYVGIGGGWNFRNEVELSVSSLSAAYGWYHSGKSFYYFSSGYFGNYLHVMYNKIINLQNVNLTIQTMKQYENISHR